MMQIQANKFVIGTVQFGLDYGISNKKGKTSTDEAAKILEFSKTAGIKFLDTAISYGNSELLLGEIADDEFEIITKIPAYNLSESVEDWVSEQVNLSLKRLKRNQIHTLMLHRSSDLIGKFGKRIFKSLNDLKQRGLIKKIGISIYNPNELNDIVNEYAIDVVQAPLNIIDRRLITSNWLTKLNSRQIEVHVRSVFLQGLLTMKETELPSKFNSKNINWDKWFKITNSHDPISLCLSLLKDTKGIDKIVLGVNNIQQLKHILLTSQSDYNSPDLSFMISDDETLINPSKW